MVSLKRLLLIYLVLCLLVGNISCAGNQQKTKPFISNVSVVNITDTAATITWTTDEPATSLVEYGTTIDFGLSSPLYQDLVTGTANIPHK